MEAKGMARWHWVQILPLTPFLTVKPWVSHAPSLCLTLTVCNTSTYRVGLFPK